MPPTAKVGTGEAVAPPAPARRCTVRINCSKTKNLIADCGMFRHSTAVHPLYSPNTPPSATIPRVACHAVIAPLTWHLCFTHSEGVYTNEVATLAHPPAMQCATHARSSGNIGISRDFTASYDAVYIAEMGAEEARLAERPLYSPKTPRSRSIRASTLARGCRAARSACMVTLSVSTGCSTMLTSVPATAPATAFAVVTRPPPPERPRSSSRVDARLARSGWSSDAGEAPSCRERIGRLSRARRSRALARSPRDGTPVGAGRGGGRVSSRRRSRRQTVFKTRKGAESTGAGGRTR